nr:AraC family transcriptional regulator [Paenibacillus wulumuqiensis]
MLHHTDDSIGEIADRIGYRDMYYFSRAFKSITAFPRCVTGLTVFPK